MHVTTLRRSSRRSIHECCTSRRCSIGRAAPEADNSSERIGTGTPNAASFGSTCAQLCRCTSNLALAVDNLEVATSHQSVPRPQRWSSFVESVNGESAEHETLNFS